jgi:acetyl-CoA carboxylase biotin carboxyl carrier protein
MFVERDATAGWVVRSPAVGVWSEIPASGTLLDRTGAGVLTQAGRRFSLRLPQDACGIVQEVSTGGRKAIEVEWGQELFRLAPVAGESAQAAAATPGTQVGDVDANVLTAPTDGVFYARPTPDAPAFVGPGDTLKRGQAIGLIEVMKTFNQVLFEGDGLPESAVVEAILVADGEEVAAGDAILRYEPS